MCFEGGNGEQDASEGRNWFVNLQASTPSSTALDKFFAWGCKHVHASRLLTCAGLLTSIAMTIK